MSSAFLIRGTPKSPALFKTRMSTGRALKGAAFLIASSSRSSVVKRLQKGWGGGGDEYRERVRTTGREDKQGKDKKTGREDQQRKNKKQPSRTHTEHCECD